MTEDAPNIQNPDVDIKHRKAGLVILSPLKVDYHEIYSGKMRKLQKMMNLDEKDQNEKIILKSNLVSSFLQNMKDLDVGIIDILDQVCDPNNRQEIESLIKLTTCKNTTYQD